MMIIMSRDLNQNAVLNEDVNNGDTVILETVEGELRARRQTVAGADVDGFATIVKTDPNYDFQPIAVSDYIADQGAFAGKEILRAGKRVLIEQGQGTAKTTRVVAGTYRYGQKLTANGDGRLRLAAAGEFVCAEVRETKVVADGDELEILFFANRSYELVP